MTPHTKALLKPTYAFLLAVTKWVTESTRGRVIVVGDALGVMHGAITLSAKSEIVNKIAMELALHLAPLCLSLAGIHTWGEENELADALSRLRILRSSIAKNPGKCATTRAD